MPRTQSRAFSSADDAAQDGEASQPSRSDDQTIVMLDDGALEIVERDKRGMQIDGRQVQ